MASIYFKRYLYLLVLFLFIFLFLGSEIYARSWFDSVSLSLEKEIGYLNYRTILARKTVAQLPDDEIRQAEEVFTGLINQSRRRHELDFKLTILDDNNINAFALPGGYIFVNSGTLSYVKNKSELAGILGHEIAHVDCRHGMKAVSRTTGMSLLFNLVLENSVSKRKELMQRAALISLNIIQLGYSRTAELEADQYGVLLMKKAGYEPEKLLDFWGRIDHEMENNTQLPAFFDLLATHPQVKERMANIEDALKHQSPEG